MNDQEKALDVLTQQPIKLTLGGQPYTARRATLKDFAAINRYRHELTQGGDTVNQELDVALFSLSLLITEPQGLTADQLAERIPLEAFGDLKTALDQVGFKKPQPTGPKKS